MKPSNYKGCFIQKHLDFQNDSFSIEQSLSHPQSKSKRNLNQDASELIPIKPNHLISPKQKINGLETPRRKSSIGIRKSIQIQIETPCFQDKDQIKKQQEENQKVRLTKDQSSQINQLAIFSQINLDEVQKKAKKCLQIMHFKKIFNGQPLKKSLKRIKIKQNNDFAMIYCQQQQTNNALSQTNNTSNIYNANHFSHQTSKNLTIEANNQVDFSFDEKNPSNIVSEVQIANQRHSLLKPIQFKNVSSYQQKTPVSAYNLHIRNLNQEPHNYLTSKSCRNGSNKQIFRIIHKIQPNQSKQKQQKFQINIDTSRQPLNYQNEQPNKFSLTQREKHENNTETTVKFQKNLIK